MNLVCPGSDSTRRSPWCFSTTIRRARSRPRPVPSPNGLVVKNGVKMLLDDVLGDAGPVVADLDPDHVFVLAHRAHRQRAVAVHRLDRVVDDVGPDLVEIAWVAKQFGQRLVAVLDQLDRLVLADLVAEHHQRAVQQLVDVGALVRARGPSASTAWRRRAAPRCACWPRRSGSSAARCRWCTSASRWRPAATPSRRPRRPTPKRVPASRCPGRRRRTSARSPRRRRCRGPRASRRSGPRGRMPPAR